MPDEFEFEKLRLRYGKHIDPDIDLQCKFPKTKAEYDRLRRALIMVREIVEIALDTEETKDA